MVNVALAPVDEGIARIAQPGRGLDQRIEHGLQFERRAADELEYVGGRGLLLKRLGQLALKISGSRFEIDACRRTFVR